MADTKVIIGGDASGAINAANQARSAYERLGKELTSLKSMSANVLSTFGITAGAMEVIKLADNYGQLTSRLQLATRYTGDYKDVQVALRKTADETRSSLAATTDMYTKMSPVLQSLGRNGVQSVGIVATVNKAIALSGVSAEQSAAGIMQFSQALSSGRLNGDELNSILENTPGLADAIAEGLGVARGALKKMGEEGKLTADVLISALEKVAPRVAADFEKLPLTVGQALTKLSNNLTEIIGGGAQATGAMGALARAIVFVSEGIKSLSDTGSLKSLFVGVAEAADGFSRVVRIAGKYIGTWAYDISTGTKNSKEVWAAYYKDVEDITNEALQRDKAASDIVASDKEKAARRLDIERQLQEKIRALGVLRSISEGKVSADILLDDTKRTDEQIKNAQRLRDALATAWKSSLTEAQAAGEAAKKLFEQAADVRQTGADKADALQRSKLTPEQQQVDIKSKFDEAASSAETAAGMATIATLHGRLENAAKLTAQAKKDAERAAKLADQIKDPDTGSAAITKAAEIQAKLLEADGKGKQQEQKSLEERAAAQNKLITDLDKQITDLQNKAAAIKVEADTKAATTSIDALKMQLDALTDKTITVTVNTVQTGSANPGSVNKVGSQDAPLPGLAVGGFTGYGGKWEPKGVVHAWEFVNRSEVVKQPGALSFLTRFNQVGMAALRELGLPGYANGGLVGNISSPTPRSSPTSTGSNATFNFPGFGSFDAYVAPDVLGELKGAFAKEALKKGGRR